MSAHLGSRISALVDGQLPPDQAERALAHVAGCAQCADELRAARTARDLLLRAAHDVPPAPDLAARLLALQADGAAGPFGHDGPGAAGRVGAASSPNGVPGGSRDPFAGPAAGPFTVPGSSSGLLRTGTPLRGDVTGRRWPSRLLAASSAAGLSVAALGLFVLGDRPSVTPSAHPAVALDVLSRAPGALVQAGTPAQADDALDGLRTDGWTFPANLPEGWTVLAVRSDDDGLEVDLTGPTGTVVVSEQQGRLDTSALAGVSVREVGGRQVVVLSDHPWHVAWQATSTVVQVVAADEDDDVAQVVAAFPSGAYDDGVTGRIERGWQTVTAALDRP